ncbi:hypothetical protein H4S03_005142 [Coemansia sp. S3946]|nr:hypothetical protein H4S03_005142 [Coemansia sp. S3946]
MSATDTAPCTASFGVVPALQYCATNSDATSAASSQTTGSRSVLTRPNTTCARLNATSQSPKRQRTSSWKGQVIVISSDSERKEDVSTAGQSSSVITICDGAGEIVTSAQFSRLFKLFIFISLDMVPVVYLQLVSRELAAASVCPRQLNQQLETIEGFTRWSHDIQEEDGSFWVHRGPTYELLRNRLEADPRPASQGL